MLANVNTALLFMVADRHSDAFQNCISKLTLTKHDHAVLTVCDAFQFRCDHETTCLAQQLEQGRNHARHGLYPSTQVSTPWLLHAFAVSLNVMPLAMQRTVSLPGRSSVGREKKVLLQTIPKPSEPQQSSCSSGC